MAIVVLCPSCRTKLRFEDAQAGETVECPDCRAAMTLPTTTELAPKPRPKEEDRRARRRRDDDDDDYEDEYDDDYDCRPRRSRRGRRALKPGKVGAIGGMLLGGGIWALIINLLCVLFSTFVCCLWPGVYLGIIWGIFAIVSGSGLLGANWRHNNPRTLLILQIVQITNLDFINLTLGIIGLIFANDPEVQDALG